jgi:hypothetical protein
MLAWDVACLATCIHLQEVAVLQAAPHGLTGERCWLSIEPFYGVGSRLSHLRYWWCPADLKQTYTLFWDRRNHSLVNRSEKKKKYLRQRREYGQPYFYPHINYFILSLSKILYY